MASLIGSILGYLELFQMPRTSPQHLIMPLPSQKVFPEYSRSIVVQLLNYVQIFATPWTAACQASLPFTIFWSLPKLMSIELVMLSNHLALCHPLLLLPSIFPSMRVFSNELALQVAKGLELQLQHQSFQ